MQRTFGLTARIIGLASWLLLAGLPSILTVLVWGDSDTVRLAAIAEAVLFSLPAAGVGLQLATRWQKRIIRRRNRRRYLNSDESTVGDKYRKRDSRRGGLVD